MGLLLAELPDVFHGFTPTFQHIGKSLRGDGYRATHEFGNVIALQELPMKIRVGLRQLKGLADMPVGTDIGKERTGIDPVIATATEHKPSGVARPSMVALRIGTVCLRQGASIK